MKDKVQRAVFPEGLVIYPEKREYLTKNMNRIFELSGRILDDCKSQKKDKSEKTDLSY